MLYLKRDYVQQVADNVKKTIDLVSKLSYFFFENAPYGELTFYCANLSVISLQC